MNMIFARNATPTLTMLILTFVVITTPAWASQCNLTWHNVVILQDGALTLDDGQRLFKVKQNGQLYFGVHKVQLNTAQQQALVKYHQTLTKDLPYQLSHSQLIDDELCQRVVKRQTQETEIQSLIPALKTWQSVTVY
ncbi:hypothetical protein [Photobacterium indicum]|uniref:hypothetical protein n=1 Tax=Photobacterium indicum TaxID=81447 RepID=UPI003D117ECA